MCRQRMAPSAPAVATRAVVQKRHAAVRSQRSLMTGETPNFTPVSNIPQSGGPIGATAQQHLSVGRKGHILNRRCMAAKDATSQTCTVRSMLAVATMRPPDDNATPRIAPRARDIQRLVWSCFTTCATGRSIPRAPPRLLSALPSVRTLLLSPLADPAIMERIRAASPKASRTSR